jgi:hypothetical protein
MGAPGGNIAVIGWGTKGWLPFAKIRWYARLPGNSAGQSGVRHPSGAEPVSRLRHRGQQLTETPRARSDTEGIGIHPGHPSILKILIPFLLSVSLRALRVSVVHCSPTTILFVSSSTV